jgi:hypothetical protein
MLKRRYDNFGSIVYWGIGLGVYLRYIGIVPFSNGWWAFILPSVWLISKGVDKLYDYLRGDWV